MGTSLVANINSMNGCSMTGQDMTDLVMIRLDMIHMTLILHLLKVEEEVRDLRSLLRYMMTAMAMIIKATTMTVMGLLAVEVTCMAHRVAEVMPTVLSIPAVILTVLRA